MPISKILKCSAAVFLALTVFSCSKKSEQESELPPVIEVKKSNHTWYAFNAGKILEIEKPQAAPYMPPKPYTEAVRISAASSAGTENVKANFLNRPEKGYAVVNQTGLLCFEDEHFSLITDSSLFSARTAGNLVFYEKSPVFSLYKNSFFNSNLKNNENTPFLVQLNPETEIFYQILNVENLSEDAGDQVTDFLWDGNCCSLVLKRTDSSERVYFKYLTFQPKIPLISINPQTAEESILVSKNSISEFQKAKSQKPFSKAPEIIHELLKSVPRNIDFELSLYKAGGHSPEKFISDRNKAQFPLAVQAITSDFWSAALFPDGTMYLKGSLNNGRQINKGNTCGIKLPKLPAGYNYSNFAISDNTLYAGWEESSFVETGRAGFLKVKLANALSKAGIYSLSEEE